MKYSASGTVHLLRHALVFACGLSLGDAEVLVDYEEVLNSNP